MACRPISGPAGTPLALKKLKSPIEDVCMLESAVLTLGLADKKNLQTTENLYLNLSD